MEIHQTSDVLDVREATVANSRFQDVNLSAAAFDKVLLSNARVTDANLYNTVFSNVNMSGVTIENAIWTGTTIDGLKVSDLFKAYRAAQAAGEFAHG